MAAPFNRIRSKLNRAIVAYLIEQGCGSADDTFPENTQAIRSYPNTTVRAGVATPTVLNTGIRSIPVHIRIRGSASEDPEKKDDANDPRTLFDARLSVVYDALMQSDNGRNLKATATAITDAGRALAVSDPTNNADMADFTCQQWVDGGEGDGAPDGEGNAWEEILIFNTICSPSNVD